MNDWLRAVINNRQPMDPAPTEVAPELHKLAGIRAVIFDIYGTLLISGSGDVGVADEDDPGTFMDAALQAVSGSSPVTPPPTIGDLHEQIRQANDARRSDQCPKPEVDIVDIWRKTLAAVDWCELADDTERVVRLAAEYESRANPTWPMPDSASLLAQLRAAGLPLGIVSNAQVFTISLLEDLLGGSLEASGFDLDLCIFSNRFRQAKPGSRLFDVLCQGLARRGIQPHEAIYVGNDMLNDVWAASQAGLKTAWFAGDRRSCRPRDDDPRCQSLQPDLVITALMQLPKCLEIG